MEKKSQDFSDLISIACHYDNSTLLTKNGELVQIIKVKGFSKRFSQENNNLRDVLRGIISDLINQNIMFFIYSKRDYMNIDVSTAFSSEFAQIKHEIWVNENGFRNCLMNSLYIAIVHSGSKVFHENKNILKSLFFSQVKAKFFNRLDKSLQEISDVSIKILSALEEFGVSMLSIVEKDNKLISEPLSFIFYLIHFYEKDIELSKTEYSKLLSFNLSIDWKYNYIKTYTENLKHLSFAGDILVSGNEQKSYCACAINLKTNYNLPIKYTDQILSLDQRMIVYETIRLADNKEYKKFLQTQKNIFKVSKAENVLKIVEKKESDLENNKLIHSQIGMIVFVDTQESLGVKLKNTTNLLFNLGISTVREDYYMMGAILSAIPGNSFFLRREEYNVTCDSAIFSSIKQKAIGGYGGSIWGKPIAIFKTVENLPFFFNFHNKDNIGHTIIVGPEVNKPHLLRYFLICESFKFDVQVINFDYDGFDDEVMTMCSAKVIQASEAHFSLDMLRIIKSDSKEIFKIFQHTFFKDLIMSDEISDEIINLITKVINLITDKRNSTADFSEVSKEIRNIIETSDVGLNSDIKHNACEFFKAECFFKFFCIDKKVDEKIITVNLSNFLSEINFNNEIKQRIRALMVFLYLKDLNAKLDPSNLRHIIISFESDVLDFCNLFYEDLKMIFEELARKNVVLIITCKNRTKLYNSKNIKDIITKLIPTRFFLSDKFVDREFREIFELNHLDINKIKMYNPSENMFLFKQDDHNIVCSFKILNNLKITN